MPLEDAYLRVSDRVEMLNSSYRHHAALPVLTKALSDPLLGDIAVVSSFGAESVVLLHMVAQLDRDVPVLMVDTEMLFAQTLEYQADVAARLGLRDVRVIRADAAAVQAADPEGTLHLSDPNVCCGLRKTAPLHAALAKFDSWITGRKRFQNGNRAALELFEAEDDVRVKVNPLAHWRREDLIAYIENNNLPRHPLVAKGYASVGCAPCTSPVGRNEDPRAGRWRGQEKTECGIHFGADGTTVRRAS